MRGIPACLFAALLLAACTSSRETAPARSAAEQLLISAAADRSAGQIEFGVPAGAKAFVDSFIEGPDAKYALAALRDRLIRQGALPTADRNAADWIVEVRAGALSIDDEATLFGLPSFNAPIPLTSATQTPELALFKRARRIGIAQFAATSYPVRGGAASAAGPAYGYARATKWTILFAISWSTDDITPPGKCD